jgi:serine/threonine protein kinase/Tfp pilus assembly protein PilF
MLHRGLGEETFDEDTLEKALDEIDARDADWRIGNYQILEEIGRGGMGVIYRARQRHSRRIVALKRILSHYTDSQNTLVRFRREAEAAASLDHPNILPIYEVSEGEDGLPFFSMKFAAGGSLLENQAVLRGDTRNAVTLLAKVARAVEYAHSRGILHRDLKPGNILLDGRGEPFVSDFGLAKWLDASSDLTRTLTIFGTPGYIAPEQANGPVSNLKATADIYSLGAILFDLLASRPPFLGEHALSVIKQAAEKPAPRLRSVLPKIDRDLETICARCLEREPEARYQSGGDLAADLERWLEGRPVIARPVSPPVRIWRWAHRNPKLATSVAGCVLGAAAALVFATFTFFPTASPLPSAAVPAKSIAVLPFENRSEEKANAYFADGIQDEILTRLSKIADLKVISRTSTQHYKSAPDNVREIAKQLGVMHIVEGSVQKSGDAVRVNVQLINAVNDAHLWGDTFDRKLTDIFSVESDVAKAIADQLKAKLTGQEKQIIAARPTNNPDAYDAYLRGLAYSLKTVATMNNALGAQKYLKEAVTLDQNFALAWSLLSFVESRSYLSQALQPTDELREDARVAADNALKLNPNLGEALLAKGYYYYACLRDYDSATHYFQQARPLLPNSSRLPESMAYVARRQGEWNHSEEYFNEAERLDPRNVNLLVQHAFSYIFLRRFDEAAQKLDQVLNIAPDDADTLMYKAAIAQAQGNLPRASGILESLHSGVVEPRVLETQAYQAILERRPVKAISRLKEATNHPDPKLGYVQSELLIWLGWVQELAGDHNGAQRSWLQGRDDLGAFLKNQPNNYIVLGYLALANAGLGEKETALAMSQRAAAAIPTKQDALAGPGAMEILARVAARTGEADAAISAIEKLVAIPYESPFAPGVPLTPALLQLDPTFDAIRNLPRFQRLANSARGAGH